MTEKFDVAVVGGGVIGVCSAYYLAKRGVRVALLERRGICSGASYGNAGLLTPSHSLPLAAPGVLTQGMKWLFDPESPFYIQPRLDPDLLRWLWRFYRACKAERAHAAMPALFELATRSAELFKEIVATEKIDCHFGQKGLLHVFATPEGFAKGVKEARTVEVVGVRHQLLEGAALTAFEPTVAEDLVGGVFYPDDGHMEPGVFVTALAEVAAEMGVRIVSDCEVRDFDVTGSGGTRLETSQGDFFADTVVVASGALSPRFAARLNMNIPIQPAKGYAVILERTPGSPGRPVLVGEDRIGVTPMGDRIRLAGTLELAGLDLSVSQRRVDAIRRKAPRYVPGLSDAEPVEIWRGLRPCTPDGLPMVGRCAKYANVVMATGHGMMGLTQGTYTGKLVSDIVTGNSPEMDIAPLRPDRFG